MPSRNDHPIASGDFFVAKVNLARHAASGAERLRPLQVDYASRKFMLPIRLGTVNAAGPQELFVFTLTKRGRVETTNYRTVKLPSDMDVPIFVKDEFPGFYRATFSRAAVREGNDAVFLEYAWNSGSCDPCSAEPLRPEEASRPGARWATTDEGGNDVFVTRLHVRYSRATFPEDLMLQETGDDSTFQGRYVLRHAFTGPAKCAEGRRYRDALVLRWDKEAAMLNHLTGWSMRDIRTKMRANGERVSERDVGATSWWSSLLAAVGDTWSRWTA